MHENLTRTWDLHIDADTPVDRAFRAVDVEVPQADLAHTCAHLPCLLVASDANLLSAPTVGCEEVVDEVEVLVRDVVRLLLHLQFVEQRVEVFVLSLTMRMSYDVHDSDG